MVPKITVDGVPGSLASIEWSTDASGPWTTWTNVVLGVGGSTLVDLSPSSTLRFYRVVTNPTPVAPEGFVWVFPGTFTMGSPWSELNRELDEVQHTVTITKGFWISDHEVTQSEFIKLMDGGWPFIFFLGDSRPVEGVSWYDANIYCKRLTEKGRSIGIITAQQQYRLPTEAEWEYAARAGTIGAQYGEKGTVAWYGSNSGGKTHSVKTKAANSWGAYDMLGNVGEWCSDWYGEYIGDATNPVGPGSGTAKVVRGGSWTENIRSADRSKMFLESRLNYIGFRVILTSY
jgi:sulfatase modifying factor 1